MSRAPLFAAIAVGVVGCGFTPEDGGTLPEVSFATAQSQTDESITDTEVLVRLSEGVAFPVSVAFEVTGGTASTGTDYEVTEGVITFAPGERDARVVVHIVDDGLEEEEEDVQLELKDPENATLGATHSHDLRIAANKLPRVSFVAADSSADEPAGVQRFAIRLDQVSTEVVRVHYTWSGTAEAGDHGIVDGELTIPAGQASAVLEAMIIDDPTDEDDETLELEMISQAGAVVAPGLGRHVHTILDDDPPPTIAFAAAASAAGEGGGTATLQVALSLASEKPITVAYAAAPGGTATATADYALAAGTLTFPPGTTALDVPVDVVSDTLDEPDETVIAALASPTNATPGANTQHVLTITDDDDPPTLAFQAAASNAPEATAAHTVTVVLSAPSGRDISFSLARTGTAGPEDLTIGAGPYTIPAGATQLALTATVVNDALDEPDETVALALTGVTNAATGAQSAHAITIVDDDDPPTVRFDPGVGDRAANENDFTDVTYTYPVVLSAASGRTVTVGVTRMGTASATSDYAIGTGDLPVVFAPGETTKSIRVTVHADRSREDDETVILKLDTAAGATNAADNQTRTHTIQDDD